MSLEQTGLIILLLVVLPQQSDIPSGFYTVTIEDIMVVQNMNAMLEC